MPAIPQPLRPDDDGGVDAAVGSALSAFHAGTATAADVLTALGQARLLVPVVALLTESEVGEHGLKQEKESEMALPKLVGKDGREAVLAFTGVEPLRMWRPDARPVQATGPQVCQAARHEQAAAVVIDVAGPIPFVIEGGMLQALATVEEAKHDASALDRLAEAVPDLTVARLRERPRHWWDRRRR
ncbi:SseB family protein [Planotetraspora sp. A-T 1434]|uniref:SseB family protein n=1 Tax=Planotetraspora sp. A-T 1434 TaxID=2979219 RepID=UPI0021BF14FD|nr:SseB family protein [Planotetraspora sp. A-T 1434]MCT9929397.1 SseB family protein [Planotetraspora sp. A-T 1434]